MKNTAIIVGALKGLHGVDDDGPLPQGEDLFGDPTHKPLTQSSSHYDVRIFHNANRTGSRSPTRDFAETRFVSSYKRKILMSQGGSEASEGVLLQELLKILRLSFFSPLE